MEEFTQEQVQQMVFESLFMSLTTGAPPSGWGVNKEKKYVQAYVWVPVEQFTQFESMVEIMKTGGVFSQDTEVLEILRCVLTDALHIVYVSLLRKAVDSLSKIYEGGKDGS